VAACGSIIAHGIDVVEIARIDRLLGEHGERFTERCFSPAERAYAESGHKRRAERYAVRFACKEAVLKALGTGWTAGVRWRDIEVVRTAGGRPDVRIGGLSARTAAGLGITHWHVSLSHAGAVAVASVLGCGPASS
jgi:holo-[acyl-carrier protein] synthase